MRIAGGEMTRQLHELRDLISDGCVDVLQPDVALVGGITGLARGLPIMAQEHGIVFTPHTWTNGMGVTANAHLVAGLGRLAVPRVPVRSAGMGSAAPRLHDGRAAAADAEGWINLSDAPGMGYEVNSTVLKNTTLT